MKLRKHLTLRNKSGALLEVGIDDTIAQALEQLRAYPLVKEVQLFSALPFFRPDGVCFVTVIADVELEDA